MIGKPSAMEEKPPNIEEESSILEENSPTVDDEKPCSTTAHNGRLQDKVAVVTGASRGLGRAIALAYAQQGTRVVCADLTLSHHPEAEEEEENVISIHELVGQEVG